MPLRVENDIQQRVIFHPHFYFRREYSTLKAKIWNVDSIPMSLNAQLSKIK